MNKTDLVVWIEPDEGGVNPVLRAVTVAEAIDERRKLTPAYLGFTEEQLLDDFIAIHWAEIYTKKRDK